MKNLFFITILSIIPFAISCKDEHDHTDEPAVTADIQIASPITGAMYHSGDTVYIKANITSAAELHGYDVVLTNVSADSVVFNTNGHAHGNSMAINTFWVNKVMGHSDMKLDVMAIIDHEGNKTTKSVNFHCHPM